MKDLYYLFIALTTVFFVNAQQITFSETWVDDTTVYADQGTVVSVVDDPQTDGTRGKVVKVDYLDAGQDWQNAQIFIPGGESYIDLRTTTTVSFDVYTIHTGDDKGSYTGLLKLENAKDGGGGTIEKGFVTSGEGWETITVDFGSDIKNDNGTLGANDQFRKIVLFTNYGHLGADENADDQPHKIEGGVWLKEDTRYYDNFVYAQGDTLCPTQTYPVTFTDTCSSQVVAADGASISFENGYATVSNTNGGTWANIQFDHAALDLSSETKGFSIRVRGPRQSKVFYKLQVGSECCNNIIEKRPSEFNYTDTNQWQTIVFDFTDQTATDKTKTVIFFDAEEAASTDTADDVFMIDDIVFGEFSTLSAQKRGLAELSIYPNPVSNRVSISAAESIDRMRIYDLTGKLVKQASPHKAAFSVDVSGLSKGVYLVKLNAGDREATTKMIK